MYELAKRILVVLLVLLPLTIYSQSRNSESAKANQYYLNAREWVNNNPIKAREFANKAIQLHLKLGDSLSYGNDLCALAKSFDITGDLDTAYFLYEMAGRIRTKFELLDGDIESYNGMAIIHAKRGEMEKAVGLFIKSNKIAEKKKDTVLTALLTSNIGNIYHEMGEYEDALVFYKKSVELREKKKYYVQIAIVYGDIAITYLKLKDTRNAHIFGKKLMKSAEVENNLSNLAFGHYVLGLIAVQENKREQALNEFDQAEKIYLDVDEIVALTDVLYERGLLFYNEGNYEMAQSIFKRMVELSLKYEGAPHISEGYLFLAEIHEKNGELKEALEYRKNYEGYQEDVLKEKWSKELMEVQARYKLEKSNMEIEKLKGIKNKQEIELLESDNRMYFILLISLLGFITLVTFYTYYTIKQKNKILASEKELNRRQIEKEQILREKRDEILKTAVLTQEEERRKIAEDIHDGLGQLLTGAKISLQNNLDQPGVSAEIRTGLEKSGDILQKAINESKQISRRLVPPHLTGFHLEEGISGICESHNFLGLSPEIKFQSFNVPVIKDELLQMNLYRICQEIINNATKHSKSTTLFIQLFYRDSKILLSAEDNGVGFDPWTHFSSMGLKNLRNRVSLLSGELHLNSVKGQGTSIIIEIPYQSI